MDGFFVGARGWDCPAWEGAFYPDDLPPEWRLSYYANEFNAVLLPVDLWSLADSDEIESWIDDVHEAFRFFLELPVGAWATSADRILDVVVRLGDACGGILLLDSQLPDDPMPADIVSSLYLAQAEAVGTRVAGFRYLPAGRGQKLKPDFLLIDDAPQWDLPAIRQLITIMESPSTVTYSQGLFFTGDAISASKLQQVRVMVELMGIA